MTAANFAIQQAAFAAPRWYSVPGSQAVRKLSCCCKPLLDCWIVISYTMHGAFCRLLDSPVNVACGIPGEEGGQGM